PLLDFIAGQVAEMGPFVPGLLAGQRAQLLLDGLDQIPPDQRGDKALLIKGLLGKPRELPVVVSCRKLDLDSGKIVLGIDRVEIAPLDPERIRDYIHHYMLALHHEPGEAEARAERLFWQIAGGEEVRAVWEAWRGVGATLNQFWDAPDIPHENPNVYGKTSHDQNRIWYEKVRHSGNLMALARNPYMLLMMIDVYESDGTLPANRGDLFKRFARTLLERQSLAERDPLTEEVTILPEGKVLLAALARLAYTMQEQRTQKGDASALVTLPRSEVVPALLDERQLYLGRGTNLLDSDDPVSFSHQLLQEYFAATHMQREIGQLRAGEFWPRATWWEPTGWEETIVLLAGLYSDDCTPVLERVADANPEVAARCIARSGAHTPEETKGRLRTQWLPRLTDLEREPHPYGRAAVGRALATAELDDRPGVGVGADGVPQIVWVEVLGGSFPVVGDAEAYDSLPTREVDLPPFAISKYPITNRQFQAFVAEEEWEPVQPYFPYDNHPRATVNWYEAMAFCRWLSERLGYGVRLPEEEEWERAARGEAGRPYPWDDDDEYVSGYANINETWDNNKAGPYYLGQTSAVGLYPQGATPEGICDLAGNVWEWTQTAWGSEERGGPVGAARVLRGGSWRDAHGDARAAARPWRSPRSRLNNIGFRVVRSSPPRSEP
ncbi:MAG: formylglycine-generating enzyme family protein, partial [Ardenticatenaceae bacterium]